ncbi:MAG: hypothetical protein KGI94_15970 [Paracoccaceae bacterium]|nr:hypothetical protein [Paracoccaceae bacterium]MDE3121410.1 hypothetical protein [Paracoccaceae bacterium]MDE3237937.1 hypothetical protein [Paracoccaceae bacterium]
MHPIIQRTELLDARNDRLLTMGQGLELRPGDATDQVQVWAEVARPGFFRRRPRHVFIGQLGPEAAEQIHDGVKTGKFYRVRLVELIPPHLRKRGSSGVIVSVWGEETTVIRPAPESR